MNNIINLTKLSWNNFLSIKKMTLLIVVAFSVAAFANSQFILMLIGMVTYVIAYQTIAYEESYKINYLISYLPVTKKQYIASRYIFNLLSVFIGCLLFSVIYYICITLNMPSVENIDYKMNLYIGIISSVTLICILNPVIFYFGVEKGRLAIMLIFMLLVLIPSMAQDSNLVKEIISRITNIKIDILVPVYVVVTIYISYLISKFLYIKKQIVY